MSDDDVDRSVSGPEDDEDVGYMLPNGRPSTINAKASNSSNSYHQDSNHRTASSTIYDRHASGPSFSSGVSNPGSSRITSANLPISNQSSQYQHSQHLTAPSSQGGIPPFASPYGASPSSATAKESFLNYFFGGADMVNGNQIGSNHGSHRASTGDHRNDVGRDRADNPLAGRRGLEGNAAAFDMKSLDKHLEAVSKFHLLLLYDRLMFAIVSGF